MPERNPRNVEGAFSIARNECLCCASCWTIAPDLIDSGDDENWSSFFIKQPVADEEIDRALEAYASCCVAAITYEGDNPAILERIREHQLKYP